MRDNLLVILKQALEKHPEIKFAYLFGSHARGKADKLSDIDVAVYANEEALHKDYPYGYKAELITNLMGALKTNRVDVVILNEAKPFLRFQVIRHGKIIFSRAEGERIDFQVRTLNEYQDTRRLMKVQHYYLSKRIEEGKFGRSV